MPSSSRSSSQRPQPRKPSSRSAQAHVARRVEPARSRPEDSSPRTSLIDDLERAAGEGMTAHKPATRPVRAASAASAPASSSRSPSSSKNEGEGSRSAARRYNEGVQRTVSSGRVDELGQKAARALEGPEGASLRKAESDARQGKPRSSKR